MVKCDETTINEFLKLWDAISYLQRAYKKNPHTKHEHFLAIHGRGNVLISPYIVQGFLFLRWFYKLKEPVQT